MELEVKTLLVGAKERAFRVKVNKFSEKDDSINRYMGSCVYTAYSICRILLSQGPKDCCFDLNTSELNTVYA